MAALSQLGRRCQLMRLKKQPALRTASESCRMKSIKLGPKRKRQLSANLFKQKDLLWRSLSPKIAIPQYSCADTF